MNTRRKLNLAGDFARIDKLLKIAECLFILSPQAASRDAEAVTYFCDVCGIIKPHTCANGYIRRLCACEKAAKEAQAHGMLAQTTKVEVVKNKAAKTYIWLGKDAEELGLEQKTFSGFEKSYQKTAYAKAFWFASQVVQGQSEVGNLLMRGVNGTGKTHLAAAILNHLRANGIGCLFCTVQNLFNAIYAGDFNEKQDILSQGSQTPLLVLDDLDKLHVRADTDGAFQKKTLFDILDKRYKRHLPTIITTNEQNDFSPWLDGATISRLMEHMTDLAMNGVDYRMPGQGQAEVSR
jgi:DNA replication protein DnaC